MQGKFFFSSIFIIFPLQNPATFKNRTVPMEALIENLKEEEFKWENCEHQHGLNMKYFDVILVNRRLGHLGMHPDKLGTGKP